MKYVWTYHPIVFELGKQLLQTKKVLLSFSLIIIALTVIGCLVSISKQKLGQNLPDACKALLLVVFDCY